MEVEIKIPITKEKYESLIGLLENGVKTSKTIDKEDTYYSMYDTREERKAKGEPLIRIRTENETNHFLTYKIKSTVDGIENNVERETFVEDAMVLHELFTKMGMKVWFHKNKHSNFIEDNVNGIGFHTEIEIINGSFYYVEIENVDDIVSETSNKDDILNAMKELLKDYELNFEDRDGRSWPEILKSI